MRLHRWCQLRWRRNRIGRGRWWVFFQIFWREQVQRGSPSRKLEIREVLSWLHETKSITHLFLWALTGLFFFIFVFSTASSKHMVCIKFCQWMDSNWDLWWWEQPLCQLSHNHCPFGSFEAKYFIPRGTPTTNSLFLVLPQNKSFYHPTSHE